MTGKEFAELRRKADMTQADIATALNLTARTISHWEANQDRVLSAIEEGAVYDVFRSKIIEGQVSEMCDVAFAAIPSEVVSIWVMERAECVLLPGASRIHDLVRNARYNVPSIMCVSPLVIESLTTYPLRTGELLNLSGNKILDHPAKKYKKSRAAQHFAGGICESLLHMPAFTPSPHGPLPVLLLSFENKLDKQNHVLICQPGNTSLYTKEDEEKAYKLVIGFRDRLLPDLRLLGMFD